MSVRSLFPSRPASGPRWRELGLAGLLFLVLAFAIYGWFVFQGGFVADDWVNADRYYFHPEPGFWGAVDSYQTPSRPAAAFYVTLTYATMGTDFVPHLALSVLLAAFLSAAFYAFLRTLGLEWPLALGAAALLLVFPMSDSTRFWTTGSQINLFIGLYLVAAVIAVAGLRRFGPAPSRPAVLVQVLASALAVTAVAGYEIVAPAVLLSFLLYRWVGGEWRGAGWRWPLDAIPTLLVLILYTRRFGEGAETVGALLTNARLLGDGAVGVLSYSFLPTRAFMDYWDVVAAVLALVFGTLLIKRLAPSSPDRDAIVRYLPLMLLAIAGIVVGYLMLVPAADRYPVYSPGVQNRVNCFAALGVSALVVFVLGTVASMVVAVLPPTSMKARAQLRAGLTGLLVLGMFGLYTLRIVEDGRDWAKAAEVQEEVLDEAHALLPAPPADSTIFTSPYPGYSAPSIPIFGGGGNNDQLGAFKVSYDSDEMRSFPLLGEVELECGAIGMAHPDAGNSETEYGKAIFVDFRTDTVYRPQNRRECIAYSEAMRPYGPINISEEW
jgi:hypothetical protein